MTLTSPTTKQFPSVGYNSKDWYEMNSLLLFTTVNWSNITFTDIYNPTKKSISTKCCSFELSTLYCL